MAWRILVLDYFLILTYKGSVALHLRELAMYTTKATWNEAHLVCKEAGGQLMKYYSQEEDYVIRKYFVQNFDEFWIGINTESTAASNSSDFIFDDCQPLSSWTVWDNAIVIGNQCVFAKKALNHYVWKQSSCKVDLFFLCEIPRGPCTYEKVNVTCLLESNFTVTSVMYAESQCRYQCDHTLRYGMNCFGYNYFDTQCTLFYSTNPYFCDNSQNNSMSFIRRCYANRTTTTTITNYQTSSRPNRRQCDTWEPPTRPALETTTTITTELVTTTTEPTSIASVPETTRTESTTITTEPETTTTESTTIKTDPVSKESTTITTEQESTTTATITTEPETSTESATITTEPETTSKESTTITTELETTIIESTTITTEPETTTTKSTAITTEPETKTTESTTKTTEPETTIIESTAITSKPETTTTESTTITTEPETITTESTTITTTTAASTTEILTASEQIVVLTTIEETFTTAIESDIVNIGSQYPSTINQNKTSSEVMISKEYCKCNICGEKNWSVITEEMKRVIQDLKIDSKTLSSSRRKLESAVDERPSAQSIGVSGLIIIVAFLCILFLSDVQKIYSNMKSLR